MSVDTIDIVQHVTRHGRKVLRAKAPGEVTLDCGARILMNKRIGSGTFSDVFQGTRIVHGDDGNRRHAECAVKVCTRLGVVYGKMMQNEASYLVKLSGCPTITTLHHCETRYSRTLDDTLWFLVMDLHGESLLQSITRGRFSKTHASAPTLMMAVLRDVTHALAALEKLEVTHSDLKPENILRATCLPECTSFRVIDLGAATDAKAVTSGGYRQTRYYRAPENCMCCTIGIAKSDVWSIGAIAVEMVMGDALFDGSTEAHSVAMMQILLGPFPPSMLHNATNSRIVSPMGYLRSMHYRRGTDKDATTMQQVMDAVEKLGEAFDRQVIADYIRRSLVLDPGARATAVDLAALLPVGGE